MKHVINEFLKSVNEYANQPAVSDEKSTFTYKELYDFALCVAANLQKKGVQYGSRVIVEISRRKEYAGCLIGCWLMGAVAIPLSDDYPQERLDYIKKDSQYELSIDEDFIKSMDLSLTVEPIVAEMDAEGIVIYTSGSTGNPKGVVHDFYSMSAVAARNAIHDQADDTERINVHGVENLIGIATERNAKMIQVSTISIPGVHTEETYRRNIKAYENKLFVIDDMGNKYGISKYHAELKMLEAVKNGMRGKIIRVGNLMGRHSDGEFQINFNTNAFINAIRGFAAIGKSPVSHATDPMSLSPIDMTAKALVLLAGTNDIFTAFNVDNRFIIDEWQLIAAANRCGVKITPVPDEEYYADYHRMLGDPRANARLQGLITNDRPDLHGVETDNKFTANILYRLGFSWPLPSDEYLERVIMSLLTMDYFDLDEN